MKDLLAEVEFIHTETKLAKSLGASMGPNGGGDFVREIFKRKAKEIDDERAREDAAKLRKQVFDSLIEEFWARFKSQVSTAVESYNKHVRETDRLRMNNPSPDVLLVEKITQPRLCLSFSLDRAAQTIERAEESSIVPVRTYSIGAVDDHLLLYRPKEQAGAGAIPEEEMATSVLKAVFEKLVGVTQKR